MIRSMFKTFGMEESHRDDYDIDACLEHSEEDLQETFVEFYHDVLPEFKSVGRVVQFKVKREQHRQTKWCMFVLNIIRFKVRIKLTLIQSLEVWIETIWPL